MKNLQSRTLIHLPTGNTFPVKTNEGKNTIINSYISMFNSDRKVPFSGIGLLVIRDYLNFKEFRKPTKAMWDWF